MTAAPRSYNSGWQGIFSRETAYWAFRYVENIANLKFSMSIQDIKAKQKDLEGASMQLQANWDTAFQQKPDVTALTQAFEQNAQVIDFTVGS